MRIRKKVNRLMIAVLTAVLLVTEIAGTSLVSYAAPMEYHTSEEYLEDYGDYLDVAAVDLQELIDDKEIMASVYLTETYPVKNTPTEEGETVVDVYSGQLVFIEDFYLDEYMRLWYYVKLEFEGNPYSGYVLRNNLAVSDSRLLGWEDMYGLYMPIMLMAVDPASTGYADIDQFPESYRAALVALKKLHPNWTFVQMVTNLDWQTAVNGEMVGSRSLVHKSFPDWAKNGLYDQGNWYYATEAAVKQQMDPRNSLTEDAIFQFEQLTYNKEYHTLEAMIQFLNNTFMNGSKPAPGLAQLTFAEVFWWIGQEAGREVSPFHLAARVLQEQGQGTSPLISGTYPGYEGYYNYFNIKASGTTNTEIIKNGLQYAKDNGWNNAYMSILGGADIISANYIKKGQDTLYLEKYNVNPNGSYALYTHQYMQNISAPTTEAKSIKKLYENAGSLNSPFVFKIPVYKNMPETPCGAPSATTSVSVESKWLDDNNSESIRPASLTVNLTAKYYKSGETVQTTEPAGSIVLSAANNWKATLANLPTSKNGGTVTYTVEEPAVQGYTVTVAGTAGTGFVITADKNLPAVTVSLEAKWEDDKNRDGLRPDAVKVNLLATTKDESGAKVIEIVKTVDLTEQNDWKIELKDQPAKKDGKVITYSFEKVGVKGYTGVYTGDTENGFVLTLTHETEKTAVAVEAKWEDAEDQDGIRPESLTVNILARTEKETPQGQTETDPVYDETNAGSVVLNADNEWKATLAELPVKKDGKDITYVLGEVIAEEYSFAVTGDAEKGFTVTGSHTPAPIPVDNLDITVTLPAGYDRDSLWLDGVEYKGTIVDGKLTVTAPGKEVQNVTAYKYASADVPTGMYVWLASFENSAYVLTPCPELEDLLTYHGFSIRITGNSGIRFKTGISAEIKQKLTGEGVDGMSLYEYGTLVMNNANRGTYPFLLDAEKVKGSISYGTSGGSLQDIVYETVDGRQRYTSVLVGLPAEQYKTEFAFRGYIILQKGDSKITLYGPPVARSIYNLADRLIKQQSYEAGSSAQLFLEKIIADADALTEGN